MERFALSRRPLAHVVETWECTNDEKKPKGGTMHPKSKDITLLLIYLTGNGRARQLRKHQSGAVLT